MLRPYQEIMNVPKYRYLRGEENVYYDYTAKNFNGVRLYSENNQSYSKQNMAFISFPQSDSIRNLLNGGKTITININP